MRTPSLLFLAALLAGCTTQGDYDFLVAHALASLDGRTDIETVVISPSLSSQARSAAAKVYKIVDQSAVVPMPGYELAPGLLVLESVTISGDTAHVTAVTGPIRSNANLDCGGHHDMSFSKVDGAWLAGTTESIVC